MPPPIPASAFDEPARYWRRPPGHPLAHTWTGRAGLACTLLVMGAATFGPLIAPTDPFAISGMSLAAPSLRHLMGTDALGRDVLSALMYGARTSMFVAGFVGIITLVLGVVIGMIAGYLGGWADDLLMRATEIIQVIPRFFLAVVAIALLGAGLERMILVLALTSWPTLARIVRSETIALRDLDFVRAAEALGASPIRILGQQILPNLRPTIVTVTGLLVGQILLVESTLSFLGLGDPERISWGMMAAQAQGFLRVAWWLALFPGAAITFTVVGVNLLADAVSAAPSVD